MSNELPSNPEWVCIHCFFHLVNGDCTEVDTCAPGSGDENDPLHLYQDLHLTPGMLAEFHSCGRESGKEVDECDCETNTFSWSSCDGCGDPCGGSRNAVTGWIAVTA